MEHLITYLPNQVNPPKGPGHIHSFGHLCILRGGKVTRVTDEILAKLREHPTFQRFEKWGAIKINSVGSDHQNKQSDLAEDVKDDLTAAETIEKMNLIKDIDTIKAIMATDKRKTVQTAGKQRIRVLQEEEEKLMG